MSITNKPVIGLTETYYLSTSGFTIPTNLYSNIIYTGGIGSVTLPLAAACVSGQSINFQNLGTGILTIQTQLTELIKANSGAAVSNVQVAIGSNITLIADNFTEIWYVSMKSGGAPSGLSSLTFTPKTFITSTGPMAIGNANTGIAQDANLVTFSNAIAIGNGAQNSGMNNTSALQSGDGAIAIGYLAQNASAAPGTVAIGVESQKLLSSPYTTSVGYQTGLSGQGSYAVAIGSRAGLSNQGYKSSCIGANAGQSTAGSFSININSAEGPINSTGSNTINISSSSYQSGNTAAFASIASAAANRNSININASTGTILNTSSNTIVINASTSNMDGCGPNGLFIRPIKENLANGFLKYNNTTGEVTAENPSSDVRIKKNIQDLNDTECLQIVNAIQPKKYNYIDNPITDTVYGFIAQQVEENLPYAINKITKPIPDIFQEVDIEVWNKTLQEATGLYIYDLFLIGISRNAGTQMQIMINNYAYIGTVTEYHADKARLNITMPEISGNKLFVYGTIVNDFCTLNKEMLLPILWSAVQELKKENDLLKSRMTTLENK